MTDEEGIDRIRRAFGGSAPRPKKGKSEPRASAPKRLRDDLPALLSHPAFAAGITADQEAALIWQAELDSATVIDALRIPEALVGEWPVTVHAVRRVLRCDVFRAKVVVEHLNGTLFTNIRRKENDRGNA